MILNYFIEIKRPAKVSPKNSRIESELENSIQIISSSLPKTNPDSTSTIATTLQANLSTHSGSATTISSPQKGTRLTQSQEKPKKLLRSKWHCGIRSRSDPMDIMLELYRAIKNVGSIQWKAQGLFQIRCRYTQPITKQIIKFDVLLYTVANQNALVDFKLLVGDDPIEFVFGFFDVCCKIITELAISG